jgi:hypothetical protein
LILDQAPVLTLVILCHGLLELSGFRKLYDYSTLQALNASTRMTVNSMPSCRPRTGAIVSSA